LERNGGNFLLFACFNQELSIRTSEFVDEDFADIGVETKAKPFYKGSICAKKTLSEIKSDDGSIAHVVSWQFFHPN